MPLRNLHLTLEALEKDRWDEPDFKSHLVTECHRLRKVPIGEFSTENLRIMIGQGFGLPFLVPIALERLAANPFLSGDFYPGDLLLSVVKVDSKFWQDNPRLMAELQDVMGQVDRLAEFTRDDLMPAWQAHFQ